MANTKLVLQLSRWEALAAANAIFPELMRANVDGWRKTMEKGGDMDSHRGDLTREYLKLVNHLAQPYTATDLDWGGRTDELSRR